MFNLSNCERSLRQLALAAVLGAVGAVAAAGGTDGPSRSADAGFAPRLSETGLFVPGTRMPRPGVRAFSPQYPLWSDGADKRRWIALPAGQAIDASQPDAWVFPHGTRLWKEFAFDGRPVETRMIERRADGSWHFASYVWRADGSDADLAPAAGVRELAAAGAPQGRTEIPSRADCRTCHDGAPVPVLGFTALQLSPDRDPLALHVTREPGSLDLPALVAQGLLKHLPKAMLAQPPRIAARSPLERAALGYLHGNCGHCHRADGDGAPVALVLAQYAAPDASQREGVQRSLQAAPRLRWPGHDSALPVVAPGRPALSVLALRMASRDVRWQMPPLGTVAPDTEALALIERWITSLAPNP